MSSPFKSMPTLEQITTAIVNNHAECREGVTITDALLDEMNLKLTFIMRTLHIITPLNGGLAGADGKVQHERKSAEQVYQERGRAALLVEREARRAASLQTEQTAQRASDGEPVESLAGAINGHPAAAPVRGFSHEDDEALSDETKH